MFTMEYNEAKTDHALREAIASTRMEGLPITPEIEENIRRMLSGELTIEQRVEQIKEAQRRKRV
jgi:hypothetical protein